MGNLSDWVKVALSALVVVVGSPSLPLTGGFSGLGIIGALFAIWGIDWSKGGEN